MHHPLHSLLIAGLLSLMAAATPSLAQSPGAALPPVEAFSALPSISDAQISPDGKHVAMIQARNGRPVATIWTLDVPGTAPQIIPFDEGFIVSLTWANSRRLLITLNINAKTYGDDVNPYFRTVSYDIESKDAVVLFSNKQDARDINYSASNVLDIAPDDPDHIYMSLFTAGVYFGGVWLPPVRTVFRVDVNSGFASEVVRGTPRTSSFYMNGRGGLVARTELSKDPMRESIEVLIGDKEWKEIASTDAAKGGGFSVAGLSADARSLVLWAVDGIKSTQGLVLMSLADGKETPLRFDPTYDISGTLTDPYTDRVIGYQFTGHTTKDIYFDPAMQALQAKLESDHPGMSVHAVSWDRAVQRLVLRVEGPNAPATFYLYDVQPGVLKRLGRTYAKLNPTDLGEVRVYDYKARDGLQIPAYLTLPPGKTAKNLPVVILPHGGPMARDDMNFDWESQFLANRGYAVLRPNFRGSSGYGKTYEEAGYGQWGLKMQDDVTDGVKKLIADGIADPKRICIAGGSYGGYASLAGAAFTPDLYACAAAWAPVTDLREFLKTRASDFGKDSWMISTWEHFIGDRWSDSEKIDAASPSENAEKIRVPVLLMHGEADATVRIDQSEIMDRALRRKGKKVTFIPIEKETHYMQAADTRLRWLTELEKFLKDNIGN